MKVKFWGCRGSIPVPDSRMLKYGGNTACLEVSFDGNILIIDAGTGIRKLGEKIIEEGICDLNMIVTHSHWDHIQGFPFFEPIYSEKTTINILGCTNSYKQLKKIFSDQMSYEYFPVSFADLKSKINFIEACNAEHGIYGCIIKTIQTNHPLYTLGLRFEKDNKSFVFLTDNELYDDKPVNKRENIIEFCKGATYLFHDAQFTDGEYKKRKGWGHSTFEQSIELACNAKIQNLGFFHHDPNRKDTELEKLEKYFQNECKDREYPCNVFAIKELQEINI